MAAKYSSGAALRALMAVVAMSTITVKPRPVQRLEWDRIRRSPDVDALVLAWIAGQAGRSPRWLA
jgi:hypothetical protein